MSETGIIGAVISSIGGAAFAFALWAVMANASLWAMLLGILGMGFWIMGIVIAGFD